MPYLQPLLALLLAGFAAACSPSAARDEGRAGTDEEAAAEIPAFPAIDEPLPDPAARDQALAYLREGLELRERGEVAGAEDAFDRASALLPHFADWTQVVAARAAGAARDSAGVRRRLERVPDGPAGEWGWRVRVATLREMGDAAAALRQAEAWAGAARAPAARAAAWAEVGSLRQARGDAPGALAAFREAMEVEQRSAAALAAARAAHDLPGLQPRDRLLVGRTLLAHGGTARGAAALEAYVAAAAGGEEERREIRLEAGRAYFRARDWQGAHRTLGPLTTTSPEGALLAARSEFRLGRQQDGRAGLLAVARRFPRSDAAAEALFLVADLDHDAGRTTSARELYRQAVSTGAHTLPAADAVVRLAGMAILDRDPRAARAELDRYLADRPRDARAAPAVYWVGRAHQLAGDEGRAREAYQETLRLDPFSYYGGRAAERLGTSIREIPLPAAPEITASAARDVDVTVLRMDLLRDLEMPDAATFEMGLLRARMAGSPEALYAVAEAMIERGQPVQAALLGREIHRERDFVWDERLLRIVFQFPFRDLVMREARRHDLDPYMVAGLIRQESLFNPVAVSPVGAVGLMQVMPNTARGLAGRAGIRNYQTAMLSDPTVNVRLGTLFLADQMRRWGGNRNDVFAAYNAGPNRVVRWRTFRERADEDVYVERIPIAETRDYVKKVRFHTHVYRRLYGE
jgi:soluble lytic murein transglycosylase